MDPDHPGDMALCFLFPNPFQEQWQCKFPQEEVCDIYNRREEELYDLPKGIQLAVILQPS